MESKTGCSFCELIKTKKKPDGLLFENSNVLVTLDRDKVTLGHTLVIWKQHCENFSDLKTADFLNFAKIFHKTERLLLALTGLDKAVVLKSGGLVSHLHFHIYPVSKTTPWQEIDLLFNNRLRKRFPAFAEKKLINEFTKESMSWK